MRRAVARGRVFPQRYSTDRRIGRLSLKAVALYPLMWVNTDDQGRLCGDPEEIKYAVCPNIDHITKTDIPSLLQELVDNDLILHYATSKTSAVQMLDWWEECKLQWAWPSEYPPPEGWQDHLRYKKSATEMATENWPPSQVSAQVSNDSVSGERSGEDTKISPLTTPSETEKENESERGRRRGRGNSPDNSGEKPPSPSPRDSPSEIEILQALTSSFKRRWGRVPAHAPETVILREPGAKESAQLRDLAKELSTAGGCPLDYTDQAFDEAVNAHKKHISYVRAILLDWLGIERVHPP